MINRLKDEYCTAKVERMSVQQMRGYLFQIFQNDVAFADMDELKKAIIRDFDINFLEDLMEDITQETRVKTDDKAVV